MRLAVLADIHGNLPALQAVLAELERLQPDFVILDGDLINPMPFNNDVVDIVRASNWAVVRGNHEFYLLDYGTERSPRGADDSERWGSLHWLVKQIGPEQANYLAALPDEIRLRFPGVQSIRAAHGVPGRNRVGFYQTMPPEKIIPAIDAIEERNIISAHTHVQVDRHLYKPESVDPLTDPHESLAAFEDGSANKAAGSPDSNDFLPGDQHRDWSRHWHLMNPGSIGLPLNGDTAAQFALMESVPDSQQPGGWKVLHKRAPYDRGPVLEAFSTEGLLEAGGVIARLFYWELVTAEPEIIHYFRWCWSKGHDPDAADIRQSFADYSDATGRDHYVDQRDPLKVARV
jgi:predicted phosphodiesterase